MRGIVSAASAAIGASIDRQVEHVIMPFLTRRSVWSVSLCALALWGGFGLALPLALGWSLPSLVAANLLGSVYAGVVLSLWGIARTIAVLKVDLAARDRRHLLDWTTNLRLLSAAEFEWLVGEMLRREGWMVTERGRQDGPDGNIDLDLMRDGQRVIVQCKRWESWLVPVDEIRRFAGTLLREGLSGEAGIFVTLSGFGAQATAEAQDAGITLIDRDELHARIEKVRRVEPCPTCQRPMILDWSQRGWWLRCVAPGCSGKRDLGNEAGRAIELLTTEAGASV